MKNKLKQILFGLLFFVNYNFLYFKRGKLNQERIAALKAKEQEIQQRYKDARVILNSNLIHKTNIYFLEQNEHGKKYTHNYESFLNFIASINYREKNINSTDNTSGENKILDEQAFFYNKIDEGNNNEIIEALEPFARIIAEEINRNKNISNNINYIQNNNEIRKYFDQKEQQEKERGRKKDEKKGFMSILPSDSFTFNLKYGTKIQFENEIKNKNGNYNFIISLVELPKLNSTDLAKFAKQELFKYPYNENNNHMKHLFFKQKKDISENLNYVGLIKFGNTKNREVIHVGEYCISKLLQNHGYGTLCFYLFMKKIFEDENKEIKYISLHDKAAMNSNNRNFNSIPIQFYDRFHTENKKFYTKEEEIVRSSIFDPNDVSYPNTFLFSREDFEKNSNYYNNLEHKAILKILDKNNNSNTWENK